MAADGRVIIDVLLNANGANNGLRNLNQNAQNAGAQGSRSVNKLGGALRGIGRAAAIGVAGIAGLAAGIGALAAPLVQAAGAALALESQFAQVFTGLEDEATEALNAISQETSIASTRIQGAFTQIAAFARTTGADTAAALDLTSRATRAAADSAAFYDRSIEDVTESLQSFLKGNFENDSALGISATETTRNAIANELYGQSFIDLDEAQKQLALLALVEQGNELSGALGQAARESGGLENVLGNLRQAFTDLQARLGGFILEPVIAGLQDLTALINRIQFDNFGENLDEIMNSNNRFVQGAIAAYGILQIGITNAVDFIRVELVPFVQEQLTILQEFWEENGEQILDAVQNAFNGIMAVVKFVFPAVAETIRQTWSAIEGTFGTAIQLILSTIQIFATLFTGDWEGLWNAVLAYFENFSGVILGLIDVVFISGIVGLISNFVVLLGAQIDRLINYVINAITQWVNDVISQVQSLVSQFVQGIVSLYNQSIAAIQNLVTGVQQRIQFIVNAFITGARLIVTGFINGIRQLVSQGVSITQSTANGMIEAIRNLPSQFARVGREIISGLVNGLGSSGPVQAIRRIANNMLNAAREVFDINSPSREFGTISSFIIDGLENTLNRDGHRAVDAMSRVADGILAEGQRITDIELGTLNGLQYNNALRGTALNLGNVVSPNGIVSNGAQSVSNNNSRSQVNNITINTNEADVEAQRVTRRLAFAF